MITSFKRFAIAAATCFTAIATPIASSTVAHASAYNGPFTFTVSGTDATITGCDGDCAGTTLTIPNNVDISGINYAVTTIGDYAFNSNLLTSVTIPDSVTTIGNSAFENNQITSLTLPVFVTQIGRWSFSRNKITSVIFPPSLRVLDVGAFSSNQINSLEIPSGISEISSYSFNRNNISVLNIPPTITAIGDASFNRNNLSVLKIPNSVVSIGNQAFGINLLSSVSLGTSLTSIAGFAFRLNAITSIVIPASVVNLEANPFTENLLTSVHFLGDRPIIDEWPILYTMQCITYTAGKTGWPGKPISGLLPKLEGDCTVNGAQASPTTPSSSTTVPATPTTQPTTPTTTTPASPATTAATAAAPSAAVSTATKSSGLSLAFGTNAKTLARFAGLRTPYDAKYSLKVSPRSKLICRVGKSGLIPLKSGKCTVTVTVTHKPGWNIRRTVTLPIVRTA